MRCIRSAMATPTSRENTPRSMAQPEKVTSSILQLVQYPMPAVDVALKFGCVVSEIRDCVRRENTPTPICRSADKQGRSWNQRVTAQATIARPIA